MGQVLQAGVGQAPARQAAVRRRDPEGGPGGHDQQGLRVVDPRDRDRRPDDPRRRARARRHGRHGVDVERAVPPPEGALRISPRKRRGRRPHGLRRADVVVRRAAHGRAGVARLARARHHARGAGRVGVPLAPARGRGAGRRPLRRTRSSPSATSPRTRASAATRRSRGSPRCSRSSTPTGTTTAGNAPGVNDGASCVVVCSEEFAARRGLEPLATILAQGYVADDYAYLARTPARAGEQALAEGGEDRSTTSRASRSTRRSRPSPRTRRACSARTRRS